MSVTKSEWYRTAADGEKIFSRSWVCEHPDGVLVIAHGMAEHSARYDDLACYLAEGGFAVYMNDHRGHGQTGPVDGWFAESGGWEKVVEDLHDLAKEAAGQHPGLPVFLMGHSMGSFLARSYLTRYGRELAGCILSGTAGPNPATGLALKLASFQCRLAGSRSKGKLLNRMAFGAYNKRIEKPVNAFAWLSRDEQVCRVYEQDPKCGFPFTAGGFRDLFTGLTEISAPEWAGKVPPELPVFLLAGEEDPVGAYGAGPTAVAESLKAAGGKEITLKLYPGMRHECHNELGKEEVYQDVLGWLDEHLPREAQG